MARRHAFSSTRLMTCGWIIFLCAFAFSCAHYKNETARERRLIFDGQATEAIPLLEKKAHESGKNQLLYLLDLGMAYHAAGKYKEATKAFLDAEKIAEIKDVTSISEETGTLLVTDNVKTYKGEEFEKVLINIYLALDFALMGNIEDALVECRKVNELLGRFIRDGKRPYNQNPLAYYLSGILYEMNRDWNDAYIDYKSVYKHAPQFSYVASDLLVLSRKLGFSDDTQSWSQKFPETAFRKRWEPKDRGQGEIVVIVELGMAPEKIPHPQWESLPEFRSLPFRYHFAQISVDGQSKGNADPIFNVDQTAHVNLSYRVGKMAAKKMVGVAAKAAVGYGVAKATKSNDLGMLTALLLLAADEADLRSWLTLPAEFHIARIPVTAGKHNVTVQFPDSYGGAAHVKSFPEVVVKPGEKVLLNARVAR